MKRSWLLIPVLAVVSSILSASVADATPPEHLGPFTETGGFTVDCGSFDAVVSGTATTSWIIHFDNDGNLVRADEFVRAPGDTWRNADTGKSITVRGEFHQTYTPTSPGGDQVTVTVTGFRYMVNEPGQGVVIQEVGRIVYAEPSEENILAIAGKHDLAFEAELTPTFCGALA